MIFVDEKLNLSIFNNQHNIITHCVETKFQQQKIFKNILACRIVKFIYS